MNKDRKLPTIPEINGVDKQTAKILKPMREMLHTITGRVGDGPVAQLDGTPNLDDVHNKINELIARISQ